MALIKCTECGKEISDKAATCPNCGCPVTHELPNELKQSTNSNSRKKSTGCLIIFIIFGAFCFLMVFMVFIVTVIRPTINISTPQSSNEIQTEIAEEDMKTMAKSTDEQIWGYVVPIINANNQLMTVVGSESSSNVDIYNAATDFKKLCGQTWNNPPEVSGNGAQEYLDSCRDYILIEQTMADSLLKYLDSQKTSDLAKVQENIQTCTQALNVVATNKGTFLSINGFTTEEIQEISDNLGIEE